MELILFLNLCPEIRRWPQIRIHPYFLLISEEKAKEGYFFPIQYTKWCLIKWKLWTITTNERFSARLAQNEKSTNNNQRSCMFLTEWRKWTISFCQNFIFLTSKYKLTIQKKFKTSKNNLTFQALNHAANSQYWIRNVFRLNADRLLCKRSVEYIFCSKIMRFYWSALKGLERRETWKRLEVTNFFESVLCSSPVMKICTSWRCRRKMQGCTLVLPRTPPVVCKHPPHSGCTVRLQEILYVILQSHCSNILEYSIFKGGSWKLL